MTKQDQGTETEPTNQERFYYFDEDTRTVYHTTDEEEVGYLEFLGSSTNPNIRMAVTGFSRKLPWDSGYKIKEL
ncbi:hypothetical protein HYO99_gp26 [Roseobacter phage RD-1410W1-01]|uniref:Uncharacterized protein n=1 Tax=Roseobacter phage RD-1410W1-01 TaxID=1815984 RepID=A0A191VYH4_9CAUD|nr:hypothetical protein HYO99_gp26 [Roseobacter phage RD-1410W1-01]ANJ20760.1 hypothetical protein RDp01_gp26 [Roseobacter phage RD-1410W1-01]